MTRIATSRSRPAGRVRPGGAAACALALLPALLLACLPAAGFAQSHADVERCLLDRLRTADPRATVGELREACAAPAEGAQDLSGDGPARGAARPSQTELIAPLPQVEPPEVVKVTTAPVERRILSESRLWGERFALLPHRPNYLLPISHVRDTLGPDTDVLQRNEIKFQLSFKFPLTRPLADGRAGVFFAYTGQFWWQAYNDRISSPFRDYGHEPEVFVAWRPSFSLLGWTARVATAGFVHQSNGRAGVLSRSWNRVFAELTLDRPDGWWLSLRPWYRIPEDDKDTPDSAEGDDNPGITRYVGDGEIRLGHVGELNNWTLTMRRGLGSGSKGAVQLDWSRPTGFSPRLRWYAQYFDGYGESLLDYRLRLQRFGVGVMLNDWF